ncbi:MAG: DNA primase [Desulfobulbaceae bacterium]|nr:DNA primase [Desulfobulbaceae bacterium]
MTASHLREEVKNRVREASDIVQVIGEYVELKKAGSRLTGLCPFHAEKTPSFSVNPQGQFFHCFGCGESGDVFSFLMKYNRLTFPEALKEVARRYQIDLPEPKLSDEDRKRIRERDVLYRVNEEAAAIYQQYLAQSPVAEKARAYLSDRGVSADMMHSFRLGYAPDPSDAGWTFITSGLQRLRLPIADIERAGLAVRNDRGGWYDRFRDRVLFPILDMTGRVVAFGGRILGDGQPKYMNSPETPVFDKSRLLFGLYQHRDGIRACRRAIVVEGNFDLLLLAAHGFDNVVAPLGTALTSHHVRSLRGYCDEVVLLFDGDSAGLKAAMRSIPFFLAEQVDARVALLPPEHDPDSLVREQGADGIHRLVDGSAPLAEFAYDYLVKQHGMTLEGKNRIALELQEIVAAASDPMQRSLMTAHFSEMLGIPRAQFAEGMQRQGKGVRESSRPARLSIAQLPRKQRQLVDFLVYYPEFLDELLAGGLEEVVAADPVSEIITCLRQLAEEGIPSPDRLLSMLPEQSSERAYVAELLIAGGQVNEDGGVQEARLMLDELLQWLRAEKKQKEGAALMQCINEAQRTGDHDLLMKLLRQKQEMGKNT